MWYCYIQYAISCIIYRIIFWSKNCLYIPKMYINTFPISFFTGIFCPFIIRVSPIYLSSGISSTEITGEGATLNLPSKLIVSNGVANITLYSFPSSKELGVFTVIFHSHMTIQFQLYLQTKLSFVLWLFHLPNLFRK